MRVSKSQTEQLRDAQANIGGEALAESGFEYEVPEPGFIETSERVRELQLQLAP